MVHFIPLKMIEVENNTCLMTTQCRQTLGVDISHVMKLVLAPAHICVF